MSSPARRALRTSLAAAGIAALGVGFAGSALAAPEIPTLPGTDGLPAAPELPAAPAVPAAPAAPSLESANVPGIAYIEVPEINAAAPELPAGDAFAVPELPAAELPETGAPELAAPGVGESDLTGPELSELPSADDSVDVGVEQDSTSSTGSGEGQNDLGAMQALDMAAMLEDMARTAAEGGSPTEGRQIG